MKSIRKPALKTTVCSLSAFLLLGVAETAALGSVLSPGNLLVGLEQDGSLDSVWEDHTSKAQQPSLAAAGSQVLDSAPMCSVESFTSSDFVKNGAWPGIGPFSPVSDNSSELKDDYSNRLNIIGSDGKVMAAELKINKEKDGPQDFLELVMSADSMLEAVKVSPKAIAAFNQQIEKNKQTILRQSANSPFNALAGRYIVSFQRLNKETDDAKEAQEHSFLIKLYCRDANPEMIKRHSLSQNGKDSANQDPLMQTFTDLLSNWQKVKKQVLRERNTEGLTDVLSGKALGRQQDGVKWLSTNRKYYDMNPKGIIVEKYTEVTAGQKYIVSADVKEITRLVDETTGDVLKEVDDGYKVNYTVEKVGDKWLISDSAIIGVSTAGAKK